MNTSTHTITRRILLAILILFFEINSSKAQFRMGNTLTPLVGNLYPIVLSNDVQGGFHQVATIAERNAIPVLRRQQGMLCAVLDAGSGSSKTYQLIGGTSDTNWVEFAVSSSNGNLTGEVTTVGNTATVSNAAVLGKVLTGYVSGAGTIDPTDNILQAIQKLNGNTLSVWQSFTTKLSNLNKVGVVHSNATGDLSSSAVDLASGDVAGTLLIANGGTGAATASGARTNLGAAASGTNSDIKSLTGLTTALSVAQGGTGAITASAARASLGAAVSGTNGDITSLTGLTTALSVAQGGTGVQTLTSNGVLYGSGTGAIRALAPGTSGYVLTSSGASTAPIWTNQSSLTIPINNLTAATAASTTIDNAAYAQTWSWNSLAVGNGLALTSTNTTTSGSLLYVSSASAGAASSGLASFNFSGTHTGNGVCITDATTTGTALGIAGSGAYTGTAGLLSITANSATTGTLAAISSSSLTTGTGLKITASNTALNSSNGLLYVANTSSSTTGIVGRIQSNSTAGSGLTVLASGNVGIGNAAPAVTLDVTGSGQFSGNLTVNGSIIAPSDVRLKTHIEALSDVLEKIDKLRGVRYEFIDQKKYATGPQIGVIAQELQKVFPELVKKGTNGYLAVNYSQLTGVLIQAIKEQQQEINLLRKQMDKVMEKLDVK